MKDILDEETHVPFVIVHMNVLIPAFKPVIVVTGLLGSVITPDPEIFVHVPVPAVAVLAAITGIEPTHKVLLGPAFAIWHCAFKKLELKKKMSKNRVIITLSVKIKKGLLNLIFTVEPNKSKLF